MKNKLIINGKELKNITITDKDGNAAVVICSNGDILKNKKYKVMFNVGEHLA